MREQANKSSNMPSKKAGAAKGTSKKQEAEEVDQVTDPTHYEKEDLQDEEMKDVSTKDPKQEPPDQNENEETAQVGQKRKSPPTSASKDKPPKKEPRQGSGGSSHPANGGGEEVTSKQVLNFLLSKDALPYCFPADELNAAQSGKFKKCYSLTPPNLFTPFEHLVTASLLSKPLSHTLGMRSVRTLLNDPYGFSTPAKMKAAGEDKIWHALEEARTQHRQKTAAFLYQMAEQYSNPNTQDDEGDKGDSDEMLELATSANDGGSTATIGYVKDTVKGMGDIGAQIFCRRVQACEGWGEAIWPYADARSIHALSELGIKIETADELQEMIERDVDFDKVGDMGLIEAKTGVEEKDYDVQVAIEFVTALERAVGCSLEGKVSDLRKAAVKWR